MEGDSGDQIVTNMSGRGIPTDPRGKSITELNYSMQMADPEEILPALHTQTADTAASWRKVPILRAPLLMRVVSDRRLIQYTNFQPKDGDVAAGRFFEAPDGVAKFTQTGNWWVRIPGDDDLDVAAVILDPGRTAMGIEVAREQGSTLHVGCLPAFHVNSILIDPGVPMQGADFEVTPGYDTVVLAHPDNAGLVWVASNNTCVDGANFDNNIPLTPGSFVRLRVCNWLVIFVDGETAGDKVRMFVESRKANSPCGS